ncbi:putative metal-dependent enzyme (double-stranded beta helix superfamily) [Actinoalloteichus hoggarensis]|uniref:Cysteine dioxygenase n=1 Tax=Actinoalloteichus hoggarensis TaxID=1470176 RepID=A0A221W8U5_9PSEU|nr:cysteine dioxygenase family protein [Actinoalloteichus hoggarensis]ASO22348.1 Cysteine dioxygenase [Actinoalloteichus hoggarensis]MBB5923230.1 putative metal-dependent enzyme (double-stranded beta helix superfamily) [Actinoalloteichus hoggarensis]
MFAVPPNTVAAPPTQDALTHPVRVAMATATDREQWAPLLRYDPDQRWSGLLSRTEHHEVWLLSWLPGQRTRLHDHGGAVGAFTVVNGVLTERVARQDGRGGRIEVVQPLAAGASRVFGPDYVHEVVNEGPDPAVSVHVYRRERREMNEYEFDAVEGLRPTGRRRW